MKKTLIPITGMHCRSCELLIEKNLSRIDGINNTAVNQKKGCAEIEYEGDLNYEAVNNAVNNAGYTIGLEKKKPFLTKNYSVYQDIILFLIIVFFGYVLLDIFGIPFTLPKVSNHPSSLFVVALIGLTAGFSTCMALIGGLVLGVSARFNQTNPDATPLEKFKPHLFFNAGRIASYIVLGAVIGAIGSVFQLSGFNLGLLTVFVSLVMLLMGLQLTGISPRLENFKLTLPAGIGRVLGLNQNQTDEYSNKNAAVMGALTFFLPCGFTQAMQLYAMTTGNPVSGALIMGTFALGTAPGLLGIGGLTSLVKGTFAQSFFRVSGIIVIALSFFNLTNGLNLIGINPGSFSFNNTNVLAAAEPGIEMENGNQVIRMTQNSNGYSPDNFTVKKGVPVRWIIDSVDPNSCAASIVSDKIGVRTLLHPGENIIEFTPDEIGAIRFTCSMGMFGGSIQVVDDLVQAKTAVLQPEPEKKAIQGSGSCGGGSGCGCGGGAVAKRDQKPENNKPVESAITGNSQIIKTVYSSETDINPHTFNVKKGIPVKMEIEAKDNGVGCMSSIMIPGLVDKPELLTKGETINFEFIPSEAGEYLITCAMGMPRGIINVN